MPKMTVSLRVLNLAIIAGKVGEFQAVRNNLGTTGISDEILW